jgi:FtsZ-binding cell division protein ZapB
MITLEQIKLLESKIAKAIDFVNQVTEENSRLKKRNEELGEAITRLKDEKVKIEEGIVSALGKLNQFEDAIERSLSAVKGGTKTAGPVNPVPVPSNEASPAPSPVSPVNPPAPVHPAAQPPVQEAQPVVRPAVPSAYMVEEDEEPAEDEDSGEAELDIF